MLKVLQITKSQHFPILHIDVMVRKRLSMMLLERNHVKEMMVPMLLPQQNMMMYQTLKGIRFVKLVKRFFKEIWMLERLLTSNVMGVV